MTLQSFPLVFERVKKESARRWSNKWTKTLYQDQLHCITNFCRALLIIFSKLLWMTLVVNTFKFSHGCMRCSDSTPVCFITFLYSCGIRLLVHNKSKNLFATDIKVEILHRWGNLDSGRQGLLRCERLYQTKYGKRSSCYQFWCLGYSI